MTVAPKALATVRDTLAKCHKLLQRIDQSSLTLDSGKTNTAGSSVHKHVVALLNLSAHHKRTVARRRRHEQTRGILKRPALGDRQETILGRAQLRGESTLGGAKDARADGVARVLGVLGRRDDYASEFGTGNPREGYKRAC